MIKKFYGDYYYDLAKLSHLKCGYEYLIYDEFKLEIKKNVANLITPIETKIKSTGYSCKS